MPNNFAHAIHVTTVIDTYSSRNISRDIEDGVAGSIQEGSDITGETLGEQGWDKGNADENTIEMRRVTPGVGGRSAVCQISTMH